MNPTLQIFGIGQYRVNPIQKAGDVKASNRPIWARNSAITIWWRRHGNKGEMRRNGSNSQVQQNCASALITRDMWTKKKTEAASNPCFGEESIGTEAFVLKAYWPALAREDPNGKVTNWMATYDSKEVVSTRMYLPENGAEEWLGLVIVEDGGARAENRPRPWQGYRKLVSMGSLA